MADQPSTTHSSADELQSVTESLYKQNLELAVKNKTLSLLEKLYQISILTLESGEIAGRISTVIQEVLNFEHVGILRFHHSTNTLATLATADSPHFQRVLGGVEYHCTTEAPNLHNNVFFKQVIDRKEMGYSKHLVDVWGDNCPKELLEGIEEKGRIHSVIAFPLFIENNVIGICLLVLNRDYTELPEYEKDAIESVTNVTAVALDKATLYEKLKESNAELERSNNRLRDLDQLKTEFVAIASHQLRAPVTAIKGYASLIIEGSFGNVPSSLSEAVSRIFESSKYMASSIDDFLNVARIEQGKMKYDLRSFDVTGLVKQTYTEFLPIAEKKKLQLTFADAAPFTAHADEGKTKQIITNILDNSIKYTPKGSVVISMRQDDVRKKVVISIQDTGIGISKEDGEKLFSKFARASNANSANVQGTGLGLFVAREMARVMGGDVRLESEGVGKGTYSTIELPIA